jgi:hydroxyacylglutathione hydrolase
MRAPVRWPSTAVPWMKSWPLSGQNGLTLATVTNTHGHGDHTTGTRQLAHAAGAVHLDHRRFADGQPLILAGETVTVRLTPGHTEDSVVFATGDCLITGDTLFNGTVGNCFSGDLNAFYRSILLLMELPGVHSHLCRSRLCGGIAWPLPGS